MVFFYWAFLVHTASSLAFLALVEVEHRLYGPAETLDDEA